MVVVHPLQCITPFLAALRVMARSRAIIHGKKYTALEMLLKKTSRTARFCDNIGDRKSAGAYLASNQTSVMEFFVKIVTQLKAVNYFLKKTPS